MNIPITKPYLGIEEEEAVKRVIRSGWLSQGPKVGEFEEKVAEFVGAGYAIATTSCTTALHLCLDILGIGRDDEVIVPSYTFIATSNAVLYTGAKPVFVDIDLDTYNIDVCKIEKTITSKTKAILPVHQVGLPANIDPILELAKKHDLYVIEDAACALGAEYKGRKIGNISPLSCFSFHPRKSITCGEGGLITTNNPGLAQKARVIRSHGASLSDLARHQSKDIIFEEYPTLGYNYRMTDMQAAMGIEQMKKLNGILQRRKDLALRYNEAFKEIDFIATPFVPSYATHTYQSYIIRITEECDKPRNTIMKELLEKGIATRKGIMAIHLEPYYQKRFGKISLPMTEKATETTIILPLYPSMSQEEQDFVIFSLKQILIPICIQK